MKLVFDIGATRTRLALVEDKKLGEVVRAETDPKPTGFAGFLGLVQQLAEGQKIEAVCGGMVGQLEGDEGRLMLTPNLPDWQGVPVMRELRRLFDCPVYVNNDVTMGGLGEAHYGAGTTEGVMAYFTISTGVNAVRIEDGQVDSSIRRYEIGQHVVEQKSDGQVVTLESLVGGAALEKRYGKQPRAIRDKTVWAEEERRLAIGLYNVILDWTPQLVVLGGSMMRDINIRDLARDLESMPNVLSEWPRLKRAELKDTAGLLGSIVYLEQMAAK